MSRFAKIAAELETFGLDAMLVTSPPNRRYVTGFASTAGTALITASGSWFFTDSRYIEAARSKIEGAEVRELSGAPMLRELAALLRERGCRRLGFEERRLTVADYERIREALPCELTRGEDLLDRLRSVKEPEEVERLVAAQRLAEDAFTQLLDFIRPGRTEQEIAARLQYLMLRAGAEGMSFAPIVVSGVRSSMPHGVPSDKVAEKGEFLTIDFGCVLDGYCSDTTRTLALGGVTEEMERVYATVLEAQKAGIAAARAGVEGRAVHAAADRVIRDAGYGGAFRHGFGHGLGIEIHEQPNAAPSNEKPLPAGAVISAEPGIYLEGKFGVRIEDILVLEEGGCRDITRLPKDLLIL